MLNHLAMPLLYQNDRSRASPGGSPGRRIKTRFSTESLTADCGQPLFKTQLSAKKSNVQCGSEAREAENKDTRLVVAFPDSSVLTPDLALGQPGQVVRFEFSKTPKKNARQHGRHADVTFVEYTPISTIRASVALDVLPYIFV